jgi:hypothetical protein
VGHDKRDAKQKTRLKKGKPWNIGSIRVAERAGLRLDERIEDDRGQLLVYRSP